MDGGSIEDFALSCTHAHATGDSTLSSGLVYVFTVTKIFPTLLLLTRPYVIYWIFAGIALSSNLFYWFFMPESRGKTPLEVKNMFLHKELK